MLDTGQKTEDGRTNMLVDQPMNRRCELGVKRFEVGIWNGDGRTRRYVHTVSSTKYVSKFTNLQLISSIHVTNI